MLQQLVGGAFEYCSSLTDIIIPNTVTEIGSAAFRGCISLARIFIPNSVTKINISTFEGCTTLKYITIPDSVTEISGGAFSHCTSLTHIDVGESNNGLKTIDGNLYSKDGKVLVQYAIGKSDNLFIVADSVTKIHGHSFEGCKALKSIIIHNGVTNIGVSAFEGCSSLKIYCAAKEKPKGWSEYSFGNWNKSNCPVIWGYKEDNNF